MAVLLLAALGAVTACTPNGVLGPDGPGAWRSGTASHTLTVGTLARTFVVHVPKNHPRRTHGVTAAYPLVIVLHGSDEDGDAIRHESGMDAMSEANGFVVVYPDGVRGAGGLYPADWNAGTCCGAAQREGIDDLGFLSALIDDAGQHVHIDPHRVYVAGFSSGALMAYHAACRLAATLAAVAVVEGSLDDDQCAPARGIALLAVQGTADTQVRYDDPTLTAPPRPVPAGASALPPSVQFWVASNGCRSFGLRQLSPNVVQTLAGTCASADADVALYAITGGSHAWAGAPDGPGSQAPMRELSATAVITQFFEQHTRP